MIAAIAKAGCVMNTFSSYCQAWQKIYEAGKLILSQAYINFLTGDLL